MTATVSTPHTGIHFKETMKGGFTLGATDPETGANGEHQLAMHATVDIADIDAFTADAQHHATLSGSIDFAPRGIGMVADSGVFGLFSPSGDPDLTYMVYELGFAHNGQRWYLAGKNMCRSAARCGYGARPPRSTPPCTRAPMPAGRWPAPVCWSWA